MAFTWFFPVLLSLAGMLWPAMLSPNVSPAPEVEPHHGQLAGDLLIASPRIRDPRFWHSVILIVKQDEGGAFGVVINHPIGTMPLANLLKAMGRNETGIEGNVRIFSGGPVEPTLGYVLHSTDYRSAGTIDIDGRVAMTENPQILLDIGHGHGPAKSLVAFGYAGWGPGQLTMELARGDWFITLEDPKLVFEDQRDRVWDDAMARRGTSL